MELPYKPDWELAQQRIEAWWQGGVLDRAAIQVRAPRAGHEAEYARLTSENPYLSEDEIIPWFTDPARVIPRQERLAEITFWGGEAMPVIFPVSTRMVAILAAFVGCPYTLHAHSHTGWAHPIIDDWGNRPRLGFDPQNAWWQTARRLLEAGAQRAPSRFYVGLPDLNGPTEILSRLRDPQRLAIDLLEQPEAVVAALAEVNEAWLRYWEACCGVIHQWVGGYFTWMGIWSDRPSADLQSDFSCLISPRMFEQLLLPAIEQQTHWVERTIYHLDGPDAVRHLELLLDLPALEGIQWVPGAGAPPMSAWIRLLRRIQARQKRLVLACEPDEVEALLAQLEPEGLLLQTQCATQEQAESLLRDVARWSAPRQWLVPAW